MHALVFGLSVGAFVLGVLSLSLRRHARELKTHRQAFEFHALRDRLQDLTMDGKIKQDSTAYRFLYGTVSMAIGNAGTFRLRDVLRLARQVDSKVRENSTKLWRDLLRQDENVQALAAAIFATLTRMLIANDILVALGFRAAFTAGKALSTGVALMDRVAKHLVPTQAEAVNYARKYHHLSERLAG